MKYIRYIILVFIFVVIVLYLKRSERKATSESKNDLHNSISFEGRVTKIFESDNHNFGIICLKLTKSSVQYFHSESKGGKFPYEIKDSIAEIYTQIPDNISVGDSFKLISNQSAFYYYKAKQPFVGGLSILFSSRDIEYINENTTISR